MPRKKITPTNEPAPTEPENKITAEQPKARRQRKTAAPEVTVVPEAVVEAKPARSRPKKAETKPEEKTLVGKVKRLFGRKPAPEAEEVAIPIIVDEEPAKPADRRKRKDQPKEVQEPVETEPIATFRPVKNRRSKPETVEPVAEPAKDVFEGYQYGSDAPPAKGRRGRGRKASEPVAEEALKIAEKDDDLLELEKLLAEANFPIPDWRGHQKTASPPKAAASEEGQVAPRRSRRRRGQDQAEGEITAAAALQAPSEKPESERQPRDRRRRGRPEKPAESPKPVVEQKPAPVLKPLIPTPEDAPQIVLRNGVPTLVRNHRVYPPIAFFGSASDERRAETVLDEIRMAGEAGVHIHQHLVEFEVEPASVENSVAFAAYMLSQTLKADPEAQVVFRIVFVAPSGWQEKFQNARYYTADNNLADPSVCDDAYWNVAREALTSFIQQLRLLPNAESILGVHLERGEWFYGSGWGYDTSNAARTKFREWTRTRYGDDVVALRAAWFDGGAQFPTLQIPEYQTEEHVGEKFVRASRKERRWVDYHLFLSDATVERIGDLAYAAKGASDGYFLVGVSYGYTFEWSHPSSGHLSLGKLLRTPEIDFIAGPPSYRTREPGGASPFPCPVDSFALNGKLYISEEDFKTSIGGHHEPDDFNPVIKTPQALESVHWRGAGSALAHASGVCWMDLWGNGWLKTPVIWDRARKVLNSLVTHMAAPLTDPDVAIFVDERALAYLVDQRAFALLVQNVREAVLRSGLSAGFYLLSDLQHREKFPESKLYVFLNAWDVRPELRAAIKTRLQRDNKVLFWLYAAGLFDSGRESLERAREVTGIALKPQPFYSRSGTTILNRRHPLCEAFPDKGLIGGAKLEPSYFAIPEEATVLGEYSQTGLPSFVVKEFQHENDPTLNWTSVFMGEPMVTPSLLRALAQLAGIHIWNYQEDVVHVRAPFLTVHCTGTGQRTLTLPSKWSAYNLVTEQWATPDSTSVRFHGIDGSTHVFLVGIREELEQLLSADRDSLLRLEDLPAKPENTIRFDAATFDVPIMKLDEWIVGSEGDEIADEMLFKPLVIEEPDGDSEKVGRRRRRRGGRGRDSEESSSRRREGADFDEELGMNIVFRKRD